MLNDTLFWQVVLLTQGYLSQQENTPHEGYQSVPFHLAEGFASHWGKYWRAECLSDQVTLQTLEMADASPSFR